MNREAVVGAAREFLRTRRGFNAAPTICGLSRHVKATIHLYEAFVPTGGESRIARLQFGVMRLVLIAVSDTMSILNKATRLFLF